MCVCVCVSVSVRVRVRVCVCTHRVNTDTLVTAQDLTEEDRKRDAVAKMQSLGRAEDLTEDPLRYHPPLPPLLPPLPHPHHTVSR